MVHHSSQSSLLLLFIAICGWCAGIASACQCQLATPEANYCAADWVARVKVVKRQDGVRMPAGIVDRQQMASNSRHEVKYLQMFKISKDMRVNSQNLVELPINVYTATEDAACGILLETEHEYLLSGQYVNGTMVTRLCGQILLEDLKESRKHDILEWAEVPEKIKQQLARQEFNPACAKLEQQETAAATAGQQQQQQQPQQKQQQQQPGKH